MGLFESKTERAERLYQQGLRTKNRNGQEKLYLKAAELGNCDAMADLAFNYKCIWSRDNDKALVWYEKAAEHGSVDAILKLLEWYYFDGDCPYFDPQRGWDWVERSKSMTFPKHRAPWAEDLSRYYTPEGLYALALKHTGKGLGHYLLKAAAERGHSAAQARHDCLMTPPAEDGDPLECARRCAAGVGDAGPDYVRAAVWYEEAIAQKKDEGLIGLGDLYLTGTGVETDTARSVELYVKAGRGFYGVNPEMIEAAAKEEKAELAVLMLGLAYMPSDMYAREALSLLLRSAEDGYLNAMPSLCALYLRRGETERARFWFGRWVSLLEAGSTVAFGAFPQRSWAYYYERQAFDSDRTITDRSLYETVSWSVLKKERDRVLLLCSAGLLYAESRDMAEFYVEKIDGELFSETERMLVGGEAFLLSRAELEQYVTGNAAINMYAADTNYACVRQADSVGLHVERTASGFQFSYTTDWLDDETRYGGTYKEWMDRLTSKLLSAWVLSDGVAGCGEAAENYNIAKAVIRPAVWLRMPDGDADAPAHN